MTQRYYPSRVHQSARTLPNHSPVRSMQVLKGRVDSGRVQSQATGHGEHHLAAGAGANPGFVYNSTPATVRIRLP